MATSPHGPYGTERPTGKIGPLYLRRTKKGTTTLTGPRAKLRPSHPLTPAQHSHRAAWGWTGAQWALLTPTQKSTWTPHAAPTDDSLYKAYMRFNTTRRLHGLPPIPDLAQTEPPAAYYPPVFLNDNETGFQTIGEWLYASGPGFEEYYRGNTHFRLGAPGTNLAQWSQPNLPAATYRISATWTAYHNRATNAAYSVYDGSTLIATYTVNQQINPADFSDDGALWHDLGSPPQINSGTAIVQLDGNANQYLIADAVRIQRTGSAPPAPPSTTCNVDHTRPDAIDLITCSITPNAYTWAASLFHHPTNISPPSPIHLIHMATVDTHPTHYLIRWPRRAGYTYTLRTSTYYGAWDHT